MRKFLRFLLFSAVVAAVIWATRERMLPAPQSPEHNPPPFRQPPRPRPVEPAAPTPAPAAPPAATPAPAKAAERRPKGATPDDLKKVKGIGPVYARRLAELGITTFAALVGADSEMVSERLEVPVASVVDWKTQASAFLD